MGLLGCFSKAVPLFGGSVFILISSQSAGFDRNRMFRGSKKDQRPGVGIFWHVTPGN